MEQKIEKNEGVYISHMPRWIENGHIFLWLIKDTCWALGWKIAGTFMILPTISVALYILWRSRGHRVELFHNTAICLWISANSIWMVGEFLEKDAECKQYSIVLFVIGIVMLVSYYIFFFKKDRQIEREQEIRLNKVL
ncbi:MAG: hypothetical protein K0Q79_613 [Flavipsychrobacter sp.]|jgi:hypothetical protein|nr:hypothetical protein [Flavipsychrobacter sp.]